MKPVKIVSAALAVSALLVVLCGCESQEGPLEKAGKEVDKAVEQIGEQMEKAGDSIKDATTPDNK